MRTTITLDQEEQRLLKEAADRGRLLLQGQAAPFQQPIFSMGRAEFDLTKSGALAASLEDLDTIAASQRIQKLNC